MDKISKNNFEKLDVWKLSLSFSNDIYNSTRGFPKEEQFSLVNQTRRASVSIASNIAEGAGRRHKQDFIRFLRISIASVYECITQCLLQKIRNIFQTEIFKNCMKNQQEFVKCSMVLLFR